MCQEVVTDKTHRSRTSHSQIVNKVENYLADHSDQPVSIPQLGVLAGVSERTLRSAFQTVLGISPKAYIRARRLRNARSRLRQSSSEDATVSGIAMSSGFSHLGHFAQEYYAFFGETPSETLRASTTRKAL